MTQNLTIGFIGYGNMAQAIAQGFVDAGVVTGGQMVACAAHYDKLEKTTAELGVRPLHNALEVVTAADVVIIAIKPYQIAAVVKPLADELAKPGKIVVSIAAGWNLKKYQDLFATEDGESVDSSDIHIQCTIPNTPMAVGKGVLVTESVNTLTDDETETFEQLFGPISLIERVDTAHMNIAMVEMCIRDRDKSVTFTAGAAEAQADAANGPSGNDANGSAENGNGQSGGTQTLTLKPRKVDYRRIASNYAAVAFVDASHFTNGGIKADGHIMLMRIDAEGAGVALNDVFTNVQNVFSASAGVTVTGPVAERTQWETMINGMMALLVGLIAVAVLIALVGVANTLSLSVIERTRESATLRAIGMTRGQLRRSLAVEALLLSLVSGVVGVVLGTLFGWLGSYMVFSLYGDTVFPFEWATNGVVLGVAALAALLASVAPARRAVKTPPVEALAEA